jgi:hypothetical protein
MTSSFQLPPGVGSDLSVFQKGLSGSGIEVRLLEWYPK